MQSLTKVSGLIFLIFAALAVILGIVDMAPEFSDAGGRLLRGGAGSDPLPIATSVKYKIGGELAVDIIVAGAVAIFGWFLFTSEIQQTWAVVITGIIVLALIVTRVTPLVPLNAGKVSPGFAFWGAEVYADVYHPPLKAGSRGRRAMTFPQPQHVRLGVTKPSLSGEELHVAETVVLDFTRRPRLIDQFYGHPRGAKLTGSLAGTRTILDYDFDKIVYTVPHLMVEKVEPLSGGGSR